jgi:hypothetical protein
MLAGLDSWNVPLSHSINSMPSLSHSSNTLKNTTQNNISQALELHCLESSDFVMSSCAADSTINIWSTKAGLNKIADVNFKI